MSKCNESEKAVEQLKNEHEGLIDPMTFMTEDEAVEENKKAYDFIKAFRFGTPEFFSKIKEVYELEGIKGLKRLEMSLDTYMGIRNAVFAEIMASNPNDAVDINKNESKDTENGEEETAE